MGCGQGDADNYGERYSPMFHPGDGEQPIVVINVYTGQIGDRKVLDAVVIVYAAARADDLVGPPNVVQELSVLLRPSEYSQVSFDRL